jgi:hypothetical protein
MIDTYRVFAYDINTNSLIAELPANGLTFDCRLNDAGSISFNLNISRPVVRKIVEPLLSYQGVPFAVYVDRDGSIVWGGVIWTWSYSRSSGTLSLGGKEWLSYFSQRFIDNDYSEVTYPSGVDPAWLVADVLTKAQFPDPINFPNYGNVHVNVVGGSSSLTPVIPGYPAGQITTVAQVISDQVNILQLGKGTLDTVFSSQWDSNGNPVTTATILSPRAGLIGSASPLMFDIAHAIDYTWPIDNTQVGNALVITGSSNGDLTPIAFSEDPSTLAAGLGTSPLLNKNVSFSNITSQEQINAVAPGLSQQFWKPIATPTITVPASSSQPLGSWSVGDDARIYLNSDELFISGIDEYLRIVQYAVTVPDEGLPTVALTFNPAPVY